MTGQTRDPATGITKDTSLIKQMSQIIEPAKITPMLQQYLSIKEQHRDTILFYRMGDFYEMFFEDAEIASRALGITLTSRNSKDDKNKVPMCGVPYHAASSYLAKLVRAGFRVAICDQVEDPKTAKGIVKREVTRVVTPGLVTEEQLLDGKDNRYLAAICFKNVWGLSLLDLSTGEFLVGERVDLPSLMEELTRLQPSELLLDNHIDQEGELLKTLQNYSSALCLTSRPTEAFDPERARENLLDHFQTANFAGFGCEHMDAGLSAAGALLNYLQETQKSDLSHIEKLTPLELNDVLIIDESSRRNLELTQTIIGAKREGSLLAALDYTQTPMGARLLKKNLLFPSQDYEEINSRLDAVTVLHENPNLCENLQELLARMYDLERLNSRIVLGHGNGRDLTALKLSLVQLPRIKEILADCRGILGKIHQDLDLMTDLHDLIEYSIRDDTPVTLRDGNLIKGGYNRELDELISLLQNGKSLIAGLEARERQRSGITNLKIGFNKVFGYYLEVSRGQLENVPDYFIRKQTLVNAERFITPELKEFEGKVLGAEEKRLDLEYQLFVEIRSKVAAESSRILRSASLAAQLDFFACLAQAARKHHYVRPIVTRDEEITITEGRHPVIESALPQGRFVPNDIHLDQTSDEVLIITGPNMAGKSTVLRQTALIVLMAQMGSYVPAAAATIGIVDRIFTRVGAMDDLRRAQSTFMVEMNETANILNNATERSLVILDEIGRGTSTFDGLSIAWAVTEDLVNKNNRGVKTIFATHYHELTDLAFTNDRVKNYNIAVREWNDSIIFLHKLMPGGTNRSYGIQVAALAGVPKQVVARAKELLHNIEKGEFTRQGKPRIAGAGKLVPTKPNQLALFAPADDPLRKKLADLKLDRMTPLEALSLLYELKELSYAEG